jgi:hypothetical protein
MVERLDLLIASKNAGNHSIEVHNECVKILDKLLKMKFIKKSHHRSICSTLSREPSVNFFKLSLMHIRSKDNDFGISYSETLFLYPD